LPYLKSRNTFWSACAASDNAVVDMILCGLIYDDERR